MASRIRNARRRDKTHVSGFVILAIIITLFAALAAGVFSGFKLIGSWLQDLPDYTDADSYLSAEPTQILDADGNVIASLYLQNRKTVEKDQVSDWVFKATVDTEDERFYSHKGVDLKGIARAAFKTLTGGGMEGASTITQQLVRNTVLSDEQFEKSLRRKVREAYIALELEKRYNKDEILMMYINTIYYGSGAYGIEAAARTYLGKSAKDLDLAESALLSGLPQSPNKLDPTKNPDEAKKRRDTVLRRMLSNGDINEAQYNEATNSEITLKYTPPTNNGTLAYPYFVDAVKSILLKEYPRDILFKSGLTVKTTLQPKLQKAAEESVLSVVGDVDKLESALVCIDASNGDVVAMVGGKSYEQDQFNLATQAKRQAGSSFKVFTLAAAIQEGLDPETRVLANSPAQITPEWQVSNFANENAGVVSLKEATWRSLNTAYARVAHAMGADKIVSVAKKMGITSKLGEYDAVTLGTEGVTPLEMASAYATLASNGVYHKPVMIAEILDRKGTNIFTAERSSEQVLDPKVASAVTKVLRGVMTNGTGKTGDPGTGQVVAGKTGTTQNIRDLWLCGYSPQYSTAVWVGYRKEATIKYKGANGTTRALPIPIWKNFMSSALQGLAKKEFVDAGSPEYKSDLNWDLGANYEENTVDAEGRAYIQSLKEQYPGYKIVQRFVEDSSTPAGSIIRTEQSVLDNTITVYISKGNPDDNLERGENSGDNDFNLFMDDSSRPQRNDSYSNGVPQDYYQNPPDYDSSWLD